MSRFIRALAIAWCATAMLGCDVEQDLGASDAGTRESRDAGSEPGPLVTIDGEVVDAEGNPAMPSPNALTLASALCPTPDRTLCLSQLTELDRNATGMIAAQSLIAFDEAGNQYRSFAMDDAVARTSYTAAGRPRWARHGSASTLEIGGGHVCVLGYERTADDFDRELGAPITDETAIACYDTDGRPLWRRYISFGSSFTAADYDVDPAGNVYVVGDVRLEESGDYEAYVLKVLADGEAGWTRMFTGPDHEEAFSVTADSGGLRVLGHVPVRIDIGGFTVEHDQSGPIVNASPYYEEGAWLASLTLDGEPVYAVALHPIEDTRETVWDHAMWTDGAGGTVLAIEWLDSFRDFVRIDATGAIESKKLETIHGLTDIAGLVPFGEGFVLAGTCQDDRLVEDGCLIVLDRELDELTSARYGRPYPHGDPSKSEGFESVAVGPDGALYVGGYIADRHEPSSFFARITAPAP